MQCRSCPQCKFVCVNVSELCCGTHYALIRSPPPDSSPFWCSDWTSPFSYFSASFICFTSLFPFNFVSPSSFSTFLHFYFLLPLTLPPSPLLGPVGAYQHNRSFSTSPLTISSFSPIFIFFLPHTPPPFLPSSVLIRSPPSPQYPPPTIYFFSSISSFSTSSFSTF